MRRLTGSFGMKVPSLKRTPSHSPSEGQSHIVAIGGGSFRQTERYGFIEPTALLRYVLDLTGQDRPKLGLLATATGDDADWLLRMYGAFARWDVEVSHLTVFPMPNVEDPREWILEQDAIYVSGGSVANLAALWRLHGLDEAFAEAWRAGIVLSGQSAGALCTTARAAVRRAAALGSSPA